MMNGKLALLATFALMSNVQAASGGSPPQAEKSPPPPPQIGHRHGVPRSKRGQRLAASKPSWATGRRR